MTQNDNATARSSLFRRWWTVWLMLACLGLRSLLLPSTIETYYSRGFFVGFRNVWDFVLGSSTLPLFIAFWLVLIGWLILLGFSFRRDRRMQGDGETPGHALFRRLIMVPAFLVAAFLLMWGFNYGRVEVNEQLGFAYHAPGQEELRSRVETLATELADLRQQLTTDTSALSADFYPNIGLEDRIRPLLVKALLDHGYPAPGRPRARQLIPGMLLRFGTAGVYWPWAGQGNIDAGLHSLQKPPIMAHELAHAYGFGDEGTCSFWAWLAGQETTDPALRYAFALSYWRRLAGKLRQLEPDAYWAWRAESLNPGIRNDLQAIYDNGELYKDIAPVIRDATYDTYLKAQGIHEGLLNYGKVVRMVEGYRKYQDQ